MIYKNFDGKKLSMLGMGTMRLPTLNGKNSEIDIAETKRMVRHAIDSGVNYFDTAYGYHDGMSERVVGEVLSEYPRDSFYLASKFPGYDLSNLPKVKEIFEQQLEKCNVDYFDFYLFHNVCEMNIDGYLDEKYGIFEYLTEQKKNGRIKHLGFSGHGSVSVLKRFLEKYGYAMDFGQLQLNWLDWEFQDANAKYELLESYDIPVWVMEPLRGGKLCRLSTENTKKLSALRQDETPTSFAFRFLQSLSSVTVILSGMSNYEQIAENINTFSDFKPTTLEENNVLFKIAKSMTSKNTLPCTACRYCTSHCPMELDIPMLIELYNEHKFTGGGFLAPMALMAVDNDKQPSSCIGCRSCEAVCPQNIKISEAMADFSSML